jgi:putative RNA 2'-phosphotransferase
LISAVILVTFSNSFILAFTIQNSFSWVAPELEYCESPEFLYHGTTTKALEAIEDSGAIKKMKRHAVHMQADINKAWQSAERWHQTPVVLKIDARKMSDDGYKFGVTENEVWCTEEVPTKYISDRIYDR